MNVSITVIFATFNRAESLHKTLEEFQRLDLERIRVQFVVIMNNCSDSTTEVLSRFKDLIPLIILKEPTPGKNRALNKALSSVELSELVVFCDDDISPCQNWLQEIAVASTRNPDKYIFGGRIIPRWPKNITPTWAKHPFILSMGFSHHDLGGKQIDYPSGSYPFGPNFWVRKSVFEGGRTYSESIGPKGAERIMGSETSFLKQLELEGFKARYIPDAIVEHRIKESDIYLPNFYKRAESYGKGRAHMSGVNYHNLLVDRPNTWKRRQILKLIFVRCRWLLAKMIPIKVSRVRTLVNLHIEIGRISESFKLAKKFQKP